MKNFTGDNKQKSQDTMVKLYRCLIRSRVDFSTVAITNISCSALKSLETLQRTCLLAATGCVAQSSTEVLNVISNVLPIDIHLKKRTAENLVRVSSKKSVVKEHFLAWRNSDVRMRYVKPITSFSKLIMAYQQITRSKFVGVLSVDLHNIYNPPFLEKDFIIPFSSNAELQL